MYGVHELKADANQLYMERNQGGKGLIVVEECVKMVRKSLLEYLQYITKKLLKLVNNEQGITCTIGEKDKIEIQRDPV